MAGGRPYKHGLDYFPLDTDTDHDFKTKLMEDKFSDAGYAFMIKTFCRIYLNSYFWQLEPEEVDLFCRDNLKKPVAQFHEMLQYAIKINIFNEERYRLYNILTSSSILSRYLLITKRREEVRVIREYAIPDVSLPHGTIVSNLSNSTTEVIKLYKSRGPAKPKKHKQNTSQQEMELPAPPQPLPTTPLQNTIFSFQQALDWVGHPYKGRSADFKKMWSEEWYESFKKYTYNVRDNFKFIQISNFQLELPDYRKIMEEERPTEQEFKDALTMLNKQGVNLTNPIYYKIKTYIGYVRGDKTKMNGTAKPSSNGTILYDARTVNKDIK